MVAVFRGAGKVDVVTELLVAATRWRLWREGYGYDVTLRAASCATWFVFIVSVAARLSGNSAVDVGRIGDEMRLVPGNVAPL